MRAIIVGFGNIAENAHLPAYREVGVEIAAVVDVCAKRRERARNHGLTSYERLCDVPFEADFLDVCAPPIFRAEAIEFAAERGMAVLCEKPIALPENVNEVQKLVDKSNVFLFPVHNWKYAPQYMRAKELCMNERILWIRSTVHRTGHNRGNPDWDPDWRIKKEISGGGILMDHGYHGIYLAMYLMGSRFKEARLREMGYIENSNVENKAIFDLVSPGKVEIDLDWKSNRREIRCTIRCEGKIIKLLDDKIVSNGMAEVFSIPLSKDSVHGEWYTFVLRDFLAKWKEGDTSCYREALDVMRHIKELYDQTGRRA